VTKGADQRFSEVGESKSPSSFRLLSSAHSFSLVRDVAILPQPFSLVP